LPALTKRPRTMKFDSRRRSTPDPYPIASSSTIMRSLTASPIFQKPGSFASNQTLVKLAEKLPARIVGMEACCGAHHLGRVLVARGHDVRLMSPEYVRPYVKAQKNGDRDAEGIAEAATRPTMRFVELKSQDHLDMQTLH